MKKKKIITAIIFALLTFALSIEVFAHPGRTDSNGGHYNRKTGEYHYHNGGGSSSSSYSGSSSGGSSSSYSNVPKTVYASKVNISNAPESINIGESVQLKGSVYPENAEDKDIFWESSDTSIATIDSNGNLKALKNGVVTISAKTSKGTESKYIITVKEIEPEKIEIQNKIEQIHIDEKVMLDVVVTPQNTTNKNVKWKSDNELIAKISPNGELIGVGVGKTKIIAACKDKADEFEIKVNPVIAESIKIHIREQNNNSTKNTNISKNKTLQLYAEFLPKNTTNQIIKWSVDNDEIANIDDNGLLTGHKKGTVIVKVVSNDGVSDEIEVKISSGIGNTVKGFIVIIVIIICIIFIKKRKKNKNI
jgi:alpha-amylase